MNICIGGLLVLVRAGYLITPEIGDVVGRHVAAVLIPRSKISKFTGQDRQPSKTSRIYNRR